MPFRLSRLAAAALLALSSCAGVHPSPVASPLVGKAAEVAAEDLQGREVQVGGAVGTVRVVDFWATWCEPCRDQLPALDRLAAAHAEQRLGVYGVSLDEDRAQVVAFAAAHPVHFPILWDKGGARHAGPLDIQRLPTTLVLDRAGLVRFVHLGYEPEHAVELEAEVRKLLAEP